MRLAGRVRLELAVVAVVRVAQALRVGRPGLAVVAVEALARGVAVAVRVVVVPDDEVVALAAADVVGAVALVAEVDDRAPCLLYTSPSPRDATLSRMPSSA